MNKKRWTASRIIYATMQWSKAVVPVLAIVTAVASSIRTVQAIAEIYTASGSAPFAVILAAASFTFAIEGAIFLLSLAQENQQMKWRLARKKRHVTTLATIARSVAVKLGIKPPLSYDQLPEQDGGVGTLLMIAFAVAIATNLFMGLMPLINDMGSGSTQDLLKSLLNAKADIQLRFIVDLAIALFPPFMERSAGHLTARFAAEVASSINRQEAKMEPARVSAASVHRSSPERSVPVQRSIERSTAVQLNMTERSTLNALERVSDYLNTHPEHAEQSQREIAQHLGVSVGTVNTAFKARRSNPRP